MPPAPRALFDIRPLLPVLEAGHPVVTPNNRLRNHLRRAYWEINGNTVVASPPVYSLSEWLDLQWQGLAATGDAACAQTIVGDFQRQALWQRIISAANPTATGSNRLLVAQADEAYRNLERWRLSLDPLSQDNVAGELRDDHGRPTPFALWAGEFENALARRNLITRERAAALLADAFVDNRLPQTQQLKLESFDDLPPLFEHLFQQAAREVHATPTAPARNPQLQRTVAEDTVHELRAAATWSWHILQNAPAARIGIIVPTLGQERDLVERIFCETFEAHSYAPQTPRYTLPFNISTGTPLGNTPIIHSALQLLRLNAEAIPAPLSYQLLASPFYGDCDNEIALRSEVTARIKKLALFDVRTAKLRQTVQEVAEQLAATAAADFSKRLQQFEDFGRRHRGRADAATWVDRFREQLHRLGWPGSRALDSVEYQQINQWYQLLEQFAALDTLGETLNMSEALSLLNQLAAGTHFQAELKDSPIHILGTLEGAGLRFSHCWLLGLDNNRWPAKPHPNPLLPFHLQRQQQMPRASIERELAYAQRLTDNYLVCAETIVVSHAAHQDESEQLPSALIEQIPLYTIEDVVAEREVGLQRHYQTLRRLQQLEWLACENGPSLPIDKGRPIRGGSRILKEQARNPFNAFAIFRLGAEAAEVPQLGLSPLEKGNIIHAALAQIWRQLHDRSTLLALEPAQQTQLVAAAVDTAMHYGYKKHAARLGEHYYQLERQRLGRLIDAWLELERARDDFTVIGIEEEVAAEFAGLPYTLRIDRIDRLTDDAIVLIDYKTGQPSIQQWLGQRPDEPQLLLYAQCYPTTPGGIAFGVVNNKKIKLDGIGVENSGLKAPEKIADGLDWPALMEEFRQQLTVLSKEFFTGFCPVHVSKRSETDREKSLRALNRAPEADFIRYRLHKTGGEPQ